MPEQLGTFVPMEKLPPHEREQASVYCQEHWYRLAAGLVEGKSVLDVGTGHLYAMETLLTGAPTELIGIDPLPMHDGVLNKDISAFDSNSFDIVTCVDVIEHVQNDKAFFEHLLRVAKHAVFLTTPNYNFWGCTNKFHAREYNPEEFAELLQGRPHCLWTVGTNRVKQPVRSIDTPQAALASFAVLLHIPGSEASQWQKLVQLARASLNKVHAQPFNSAGVPAEEWTLMVQRLTQGCSNPRQAVYDWVNAKLIVQSNEAETLSTDDVILALRSKVVTEETKAKVLTWVLNTTQTTSRARAHQMTAEPMRWAVCDDSGWITDVNGHVILQLQTNGGSL